MYTSLADFAIPCMLIWYVKYVLPAKHRPRKMEDCETLNLRELDICLQSKKATLTVTIMLCCNHVLGHNQPDHLIITNHVKAEYQECPLTGRLSVVVPFEPIDQGITLCCTVIFI